MKCQKLKMIESIKYVVNNSTYVKIDKNKIELLAHDINEFKGNDYWLNTIISNFTLNEKILLIFIIESINYCFWSNKNYTCYYDNKKYNGSMAAFYSIIKFIINDKSHLDIDYLCSISKEKFIEIFTAEDGNIVSLIDKRYDTFIENMKIIKEIGAKFYSKILSFNESLDLLTFIINTFPNFQDISIYKNETVGFYKRAIVLIRELYYASDAIKNNLHDIDDLIGGADYVVPQLLNHYGILLYDEDLTFKINNQIEILHDSEEEIEIRGNTIYAIELLKEYMKSQNNSIDSITLDGLLWNYSKNIKLSNFHHQTFTIFY